MLALLLAPFGATAAAELRARLGASSVPLDASVLLTIEAFDVAGPLDTVELERTFEVTERSRADRLEIVAGRRGLVSTIVLELAPRSTGLLTVPPVRIGQIASDRLTLEVVEAQVGAERDVFVEAEVDEPAPWVQSQTLLTVWAWVGVDVVDAKLGEPMGSDLVIEPIGDNRRERRGRDGRMYDVVERRYAIFPQASGRVMLKPPTLEVQLRSDPDRARKLPSPRVARRAPPIRLDVRSRPPGGAGWWLPARGVTLAVDWPGGKVAHAGEPLTRAVTLRAEGVRAEQLPALPDVHVGGAAVYADAPESASIETGDGFVAEHRTAQSIIPEHPGTVELPALEVVWFDTTAGVTRTAVLPAETLQVAPSRRSGSDPGEFAAPSPTVGSSTDVGPAVGGAPGGGARPVDAVEPATGPAMPDDDRRWRRVVAVVAIGGLAMAVALVVMWRQRARLSGLLPSTARDAPATSHASASTALREAARRGAPAALARAALRLAALRWRRDPPRGLPTLAARLESRDLAAALVALDAQLYGRGALDGPASAPGTMTPVALADALGAALVPVAAEREGVRGSRRRRGYRTSGLPPL